MEVRDENAGAIAVSPADDFAAGQRIHSAKLRGLGGDAVYPASRQSGVICCVQLRSKRLCRTVYDCFRALFTANKSWTTERIFVLYLKAKVVYTSVERIQFSPLWVNGLR